MYLIDSGVQIASMFVPVDSQGATGSGTAEWINVSKHHHVAFVFFKAAGTANDDPVLTFAQATDNAGTSSKALSVTRYWLKQGTLTSVGTFTKTTQSASGTVTMDSTSAESQQLAVFEFDSDEFDSDGGFDHFSVTVADTGSAGTQLIAGLVILTEPRYMDPAPLTVLD